MTLETAAPELTQQTTSDIPHATPIGLGEFEERLARYVPPVMQEYLEEAVRLDAFGEIGLSDRDVLVFDAERKTYEKSQADADIDTVAIDVSHGGEVLGFGILSYRKPAPGAGKGGRPYVGDTETFADFQRRGLGISRLRVLNRLALDNYGMPLHSSHVDIEPEAEAVWRKLVSRGEAEAFGDNGVERFRFV